MFVNLFIYKTCMHNKSLCLRLLDFLFHDETSICFTVAIGLFWRKIVENAFRNYNMYQKDALGHP